MKNMYKILKNFKIKKIIYMEKLNLKFDKTKFINFLKLFLSIFFVIILILLFFWLKNIFQNNQKVNLYKKYYDVVQNELKYCDSIRNTSQPRDNFVYCDRLMSKFNNLSEE